MPWCLVLAVLVLIGPRVALACRPPELKSWTKRSPDGRFELSMKESAPGVITDARLGLRDRRSGKVLWSHTVDQLLPSEDVLISHDGTAVLVISRPRAKFVLHGSAGETLGSWPFENVLTRSEIARIPRDWERCGDKAWADQLEVEGSTFSFVVPVGAPVGFSRESRYVAFVISSLGQMDRFPAVLSRPPMELIKLYRQEEDPLTRLRIVDELWGTSREDRSKVIYEVPRFWMDVLGDPKTPRAILPIAVTALGSTGAELDLQFLRRLAFAEPERDVAILRALSSRMPEEAGAYALKMFEQPHPSPYARMFALVHLYEQGGTARQLAETLVQRDELLRTQSAFPVLMNGLEALQDFWQTVPFCADPGEPTRARAARSLERLLRSAGKASAALLELPSSTEGELRSGCPEALIMLGLMAEQLQDRELATRLYSIGVAGLEESGILRRLGTDSLLLEGMLRLALLARDEKDWSEAERLLQAVLATPSRNVPVCAPRPVLYMQDVKPEECGKPRSAEEVARQLLREARAQKLRSREGASASD